MGATNGLYVDGSIGNGPIYILDTSNGRDVLAHYKNGVEAFAITPDGFLRTTSGWKNRAAALGIGDIAANNDAYTYPIFRAKHDITIVAVNIAADATVAANASNYQSIVLQQSGNTTALGTLTTATSGFTAHVPRGFTVASAAGQNVLKAGASLQLQFTKTGTGVAMYGVTVSITYAINSPSVVIGDTDDNVLRWISDIGTGAVIGANTATRPFLSVRKNGVEVLGVNMNGKMTSDAPAPDQYYYQVINTGQLVTGDSAAKICPLLAPHGTFRLEHVYMGASAACAIASDADYWQVKITDATNVLVDAHVFGPYGAAAALTAGLFVDMGDINGAFKDIPSTGKLCAEFTQGGTGPNIDGLTFVLCFRKMV